MSDLDPLLASPTGYAVDTLGKDLYDWQVKALEPIRESSRRIVRVTVCTPNGAGKSERIVACAVLWWIAAHPKGYVVVTTADGKQLDEQLWPALTDHREKFPQYTWRDREIDTPTGGRVRAWTTDEPGRAEGHHTKDLYDAPLLIIVDEAKSVKEEIFKALSRCTPRAVMFLSSPGPMFGTFFDTHTKLEGWNRVQVGLAQCPHIDLERIDYERKKWGEDSPFFRSTAYGEFMETEGETPTVFKLPELNSLKNSPPEFVPGLRSAFIDFGEGKAETAVYEKDGNRLRKIDSFREANVQIQAAKLVGVLRHEQFPANVVTGESNGPGKDVMDAMEKLGYQINRINTGAKANDPAFQSIAAEQWHMASKMVRERMCILPLDDTTLFEQLRNRFSVFTTSGKIGVEDKHEMGKRGVSSPDRADTVCGALVSIPLAHQLVMANKAKNPECWGDWMKNNLDREEMSGYAARHAP